MNTPVAVFVFAVFDNALVSVENQVDGAVADTVSYNLAAVVGAAVAPTITTWLIAQYGLHSAGLYMFALALVSVVAWALTPETKDVDYTK